MEAAIYILHTSSYTMNAFCIHNLKLLEYKNPIIIQVKLGEIPICLYMGNISNPRIIQRPVNKGPQHC